MMRKAVKVLLYFLLIIIILSVIATIRTYTLQSKQVKSEAKIDSYDVDDSAVARLAESLRYPTVTPANPEDRDSSAFLMFQEFLEKSFPLVHQNLKRERVKKLSLLYEWKGNDTLLKPFLLMAHQDVVPAEGHWENPPFSGKRQSGYVYGRGSLDIKSGVLAILEAVESLLQAGYKPKRTVYLVFGHDEESGKGEGALAIANLLKSRNVNLKYVLDEGGLILKDALPGLDKPVALIGIAEKGFANLRITAKGRGGHSSMPEKETAVTRLAAAIDLLNKHPFDMSLDGPAGELFEFAGPEMRFPFNVLFTNEWLLGPVIKSQMSKTASGNAALRTTVAFTMLEGSKKDNVIPSEASVNANVRLMPGDSPEDVVRFMKDLIPDTSISIELLNHSMPSGVSSADSKAFKTIQLSVSSIFPDVITAPFLLVAITDSRHFASLSENIYRFHPAIYTKGDLSRLHGENERIEEENYKKIILYYREVIVNSE